MPHPLEAEYLHKLFETSLSKGLVLPPPFINLFNHLLAIVRTQGYLFYTLDDNLALLYFVAQIVPPLAVGGTLTWLVCFFDVAPLIRICFCLFLSAFLFSGTTKYSRLLLYVSVRGIELAISPRNPGAFHWRVLLETKVWVLGMLFATGVLCILVLLR